MRARGRRSGPGRSGRGRSVRVGRAPRSAVPRAAAALGLALLLPTTAAAQKQRLLIITTGGTIAGGQAGQDLIGAVPQIADLAQITVEEVVRVGSSAITPAHWLTLGRRINHALREDPGLAGIVVTHGTDSMEETSYFLHLTVRDERPWWSRGRCAAPP
ncbi:MAG: hypothetical protein EXR95_01875 [Gemmatimonadetes bacterium]|nr:hypothetical protein [Gemmatimonadota bacterium]